jgi:hypothetical protein
MRQIANMTDHHHTRPGPSTILALYRPSGIHDPSFPGGIADERWRQADGAFPGGINGRRQRPRSKDRNQGPELPDLAIVVVACVDEDHQPSP